MVDDTDLPLPHASDDEHFACYEFDVVPGHVHEQLSVRWGGRELLKHEIPIETPSFPYIMLKYCCWGEGVFECENERWDIEPGMVFWTGIHRPSTLTASSKLQMSNMAVVLAGAEAMRNLERYLHVPFGAAKLSQPRHVENVMHLIMDEGRATAEHREENCGLFAKILLRRIDAYSTVPLTSNALARRTFKRCREFIERNFAQLTTLKEVADACDVTIPYLCRLFDQFFHSSPYDYMTRLKMSRAESLLLRPAAPVREVAIAVGYKDAKLFARNFKAAFGQSPTKYRRSNAVQAAED